MAIGELQVNTVAVARVALVAQDALVVLVEPVASESPAVPVELVAQDAPVVLVGPEALGNPAVPVALVVSESPVVPESPGVPAVLESRAVRVVGVLQDRARNRRRVPAGPAVLTKWEIVGLLPEQVHTAVPSAVVEAVAAGILRVRAAAGVAPAWVAAGTAVAAEAMAAAVAAVLTAAAEEVVAVAVEVVAAAAGGRRNKIMNNNVKINSSSRILLAAFAVSVCVSLAPAFAAAEKDAAAASPSNQKQFATAKEAADALVQAAASFDTAALKEILGPESEDLVASEDPVQDKNRAVAFAAKAKEKNSLEQKGDHAIIEVGKDDFPLPIPIVKRKGKWMFDTKVGKEEILNRRIGTNELDAITICRGFDDAQKEYAEEKHDDSKVNQYAQKIISTPGKHDGLAWKNPDGSWGGQVGENVAEALEQGYSDKSKPYRGYYFKVLSKQGPAAPGGEIDFVVGGAMIGGFGLAAAPAEYRVTGVKTFIAGPDGVVFEKDLGPDTLKTFQAMDSFNPDKTWKVTDDDWPEEEEGAEAEPTASP